MKSTEIANKYGFVKKSVKLEDGKRITIYHNGEIGVRKAKDIPSIAEQSKNFYKKCYEEINEKK